MFFPPARLSKAYTRAYSAVRSLPCAAMNAYLRRSVSPSHVVLPRLTACVAAKQNGFWQIVR